MPIITKKHVQKVLINLDSTEPYWFQKQHYIQKKIEQDIFPIRDNYKNKPLIYYDEISNINILNYFRDDFHFKSALNTLIYYIDNIWPVSYKMINLILGKNNIYSKEFHSNILASKYLDNLWRNIPFSLDKTNNPIVYGDIENKQKDFLFLMKFEKSYIGKNINYSFNKNDIQKCKKIFSSSFLSKEMIKILLIKSHDKHQIEQLLFREIWNGFNKLLLENIIYYTTYLLIEIITESVFIEKKIYEHFHQNNGKDLTYDLILEEIPKVKLIYNT